MADDDATRDERIDVHQEGVLLGWSHSLGVAPEKIKEAVAAVGDRADAVRLYLEGQQGAGYG